MDVAKRLYKDLGKIIICLYLVLFPLGQLAKIPILLFDRTIFANLSDLLVLFTIPLLFLKFIKFPKVSKYILDLLILASFSLFISFSWFNAKDVLLASLYLLRILSYFSFFTLVFNLVKLKILSKPFIYKSLLFITVAIAVFGWYQYLYFPDLTALKYLNWDDHLYRIAGPFLDPAFTSLFLVFGVLMATHAFLVKKGKSYLILSVFLLVTLAFTYNRASFLALFCGINYLIFDGKKRSRSLLVMVLVTVTVFVLLPKKPGEGTKLLRTQSIHAKIINYSETIQIVRKYPLFGVGMNNLCPVRIEMFGGGKESHSCSGSDSSFLFVIATTGFLGFLVFINMSYQIFKVISNDYYGKIFISIAIGLLVDSLFVQSAFYSFTMGFMGLFYAIAITDQG